MRVPRVTMDMLVAVVAVAENHSLGKAAEEVGVVTSSAIYKRLQAVNLIVGSPLFVSEAQGMVLTQVGEAFYSEARRALDLALLAEEKVSALLTLKASRLLVGHSTYLPPRLLTAILKLDLGSSSRVHLEHMSGLTIDLANRVSTGSLHVGFGYLPVDGPELLSRVLYEEEIGVCLSSSHPLASHVSIHPADLMNERFIAVAQDAGNGLHSEIEHFFAGFGIELHIVAEAFGPPEAITMVEQRIGICLLGASVVLRPGVVCRPLEPRALTSRSGVFVRSDNRHPMVNALIERALELMPIHPRPHSGSY